MSLRWTLTRTATLPLGALRLINADEADKYTFAARAGDLIGNLQGQVEQRVLPELRRRFPLSGRDRSGADR
jgi:hypothetical protein